MLQEHPFGYWLKRSRKALDLTQTELAKKVGCSADTIRKLEAEERRPSAQIAERLAGIFNVPEAERTTFLRFARGDWHSTAFATTEDIPWKVPEKASRSNLPAAVTSLLDASRKLWKFATI